MSAVVSVQLRGKFTVDGGGDVTFEKADEGIDVAQATVQLPGGERMPFLFSIKELSAKGTLDGFSGDFTVPSYRVVRPSLTRRYAPRNCASCLRGKEVAVLSCYKHHGAHRLRCSM